MFPSLYVPVRLVVIEMPWSAHIFIPVCFELKTCLVAMDFCCGSRYLGKPTLILRTCYGF